MLREAVKSGDTKTTASASAVQVTFSTFNKAPLVRSPAVEHIELGPDAESFCCSVDPIDDTNNGPGDSVHNILSTDHASVPVIGQGPGEDVYDRAFEQASPPSRSIIH